MGERLAVLAGETFPLSDHTATLPVGAIAALGKKGIDFRIRQLLRADGLLVKQAGGLAFPILHANSHAAFLIEEQLVPHSAAGGLIHGRPQLFQALRLGFPQPGQSHDRQAAKEREKFFHGWKLHSAYHCITPPAGATPRDHISGNTCRMTSRFLALAAALAALIHVGCAPAERPRWIPVPAKLNGKPLKLIADTGAEDVVIWTSAAKRAGLAVEDPPKGVKKEPWLALVGKTEPATLQVMGTTLPKARLRAFDLRADIASSTPIDGVLGWGNFRKNIFVIDAEHRRLIPLKSLPKFGDGWQKFRIRRNAGVLEAEIPIRGRSMPLLIDTGSEFGLELSHGEWRRWLRAHPTAPQTVGSFYTPAIGYPSLREVAWAQVYDLGPIRFHGLMIEHQPGTAWKPLPYAGKIGLAGLERLDCVVDGINGYVYLRPKTTPGIPPAHNRLGATFHPANATDKNLVAHVAPRTPAAIAGIRNGDILLRVHTNDFFLSRHPQTPGYYFNRKAGTRLDLLLQRGKEVYHVRVRLRDLLTSHPKPLEGPQLPNY